MTKLVRQLRFCWMMALIAGLLMHGCGTSPALSVAPSERSEVLAARQEVVMDAIAQIGRPYRYGGASPREGFDCSGLVEYVFNRAGLRVPRDTRGQIAAVRSVERSELQAGDLVFFRVGRKKLHVGIVVDDGRMVHAPSTGGRVEIVSLDSPYWARRFRSGGTLLGRI
jgi:cell wall-associated NlpC family hydrolase